VHVVFAEVCFSTALTKVDDIQIRQLPHYKLSSRTQRLLTESQMQHLI